MAFLFNNSHLLHNFDDKTKLLCLLNYEPANNSEKTLWKIIEGSFLLVFGFLS